MIEKFIIFAFLKSFIIKALNVSLKSSYICTTKAIITNNASKLLRNLNASFEISLNLKL